MFGSSSSVIRGGPSHSNLPYGHTTDGRAIGTDPFALPPLPSQIQPFTFVQQGMPLPTHTYDYGGIFFMVEEVGT